MLSPSSRQREIREVTEQRETGITPVDPRIERLLASALARADDPLAEQTWQDGECREQHDEDRSRS